MKIVRLIVLSLIVIAAVLSRKSRRSKDHKGDYGWPCACTDPKSIFPREISNDSKSTAYCKEDLTCDCAMRNCYVAQGGNCTKNMCATGLVCKMNDSLKYKACAPKSRRFK
jgi:hypothetical protein